MVEVCRGMLWQVIVILLLLIISTAIYAGENRVALVIGNGDYNNAPLKNPVNDATDISNSLQDLGFHVIKGTNLNRKQLRQRIREFGTLLKKADVSFFYFAGHGVQFDGENYLIPIAVDMQSEEEVVDEAISVSSVLHKMEVAGNAINIVVLDACRNNPFASSFRSATRGLTRLDGPTGSIIAYATAPGKIASDGSGKNGLYTQHLLNYIHEPGLSIEQVFKKVRIGVIGDTGGKQIPWENSSLLGDFYFVKSKSDKSNNDPINYELRFWKSADKSASRSFYQAYLEKYPNGHFSDLATRKLKLFDFGQVTIRSNVFNDHIKINGEYRGSSQLDIELKVGEHSIEVSKEGYEPYKINVMVKGNEKQLLNVQLKAVSNNDNQTKPKQIETTLKPSKPVPLVTEKLQNVAKTTKQKITVKPKLESEKLFDMEFIKVPAGCFMMGSPFSEEGRLQDELQHEVCISKDYWLGKYEVTQAQWQSIMGKNPSYFKGCGTDCPVEEVSWNDIQSFIFRLNDKTGLNYRLPTEAEWEYAARAGTQSATYKNNPEWIGTNNVPDLNDIAWYSGNSGIDYKGGKYCEDWEDKQLEGFRCGTHSVGKKQPNAWGFYDMIGNVWEWTNDRYGRYSSKLKDDPKGPKKGGMRVTRGGNWSDSIQQNRSAARYGFGVRTKQNNLGFRLAR